MNISEAIAAMRAGQKVAREGWNGKNMYLFLVDDEGVSIQHEVGGQIIEAIGQPFVMMKTAQDTFVPWLCSQTDLLAEDWVDVL